MQKMIKYGLLGIGAYYLISSGTLQNALGSGSVSGSDGSGGISSETVNTDPTKQDESAGGSGDTGETGETGGSNLDIPKKEANSIVTGSEIYKAEKQTGDVAGGADAFYYPIDSNGKIDRSYEGSSLVTTRYNRIDGMFGINKVEKLSGEQAGAQDAFFYAVDANGKINNQFQNTSLVNMNYKTGLPFEHNTLETTKKEAVIAAEPRELSPLETSIKMDQNTKITETHKRKAKDSGYTKKTMWKAGIPGTKTTGKTIKVR